MTTQPNNVPNILPFERVARPIPGTQSSSISNGCDQGWSGQDYCEFFSRQLSLLAFQMISLENQLIADLSTRRERTRPYDPQHDPICRTRQMLRQMEHSQHVLDLMVQLDKQPQFSEFDLQLLIQEAWDHSCLFDRTLGWETSGPFMVTADRHQLYVAISGLFIELGQQSVEVSVSFVLKQGVWELELTDASETVEFESVGVRTACLVARKHGGELSIQQCPQGGYAVNFIFPSLLAQRAA